MAAAREDPLSKINEVEAALKAGEVLKEGEVTMIGGPLVPQLMSYIDAASQKPRPTETIIAFTEGDRKGYLECRYVPSGAFIFSHGRINDKRLGALNITHVAIQKEGTTKNIIDRVCRQVLSNPNIECVRIESILSVEWFSKFPEDWDTHNENSKVLFKKRGGRSKRKSKRRKSRKRK
jgi:hypothetical protein